jgi:hypothetical protein
VRWWSGLRGPLRADGLRLVGLTLYYLALAAALIALYGGRHYTPPPFIYQGF